jgi:epoxide hydrolase-like predicted phosphatase
MSSIKNLIFDFGNVLINLDFDLTRIEFAKLLTIEGAYATRKKIFDTGIANEYERGKISEAKFFQAFRDASERQDITDTEVRSAWLALLLDIPFERIEMLRKLKQQGYGIYMLSNINHSHATAIHEYLERKFNISEKEWRSHFDILYYSHEIGHRKPDASIFEFMLEDSGLKAEECLFIDDLKENTDMAATFGIQVHNHDPKGNIIEVVNSYLD